MKKRYIYCTLIFLFTALLVGCSSKQEKNISDLENNQTIEVTLKINMPLNFEDLEEIYEYPMTKYIKEKEIGEITGDGTLVGEFGPYATDIEFTIKKEKLSAFKTMLETYTFPQGSYLIIDQEIDEELGDFGSLVGIRIIFNEIEMNQMEEIYSKLTEELDGLYWYNTIYQLDTMWVVYYYGENIERIKQIVEEWQDSSHISVSDMPTVLLEE